MVFSSIIFLFRFMPLVFGIYYICPKKYRNTFLFFASLFFYAWGEFKYLPLIVIISFTDYLLGLAIFKRLGTPAAKRLMVLSVIKNIGTLFFFKYANFFIANIGAVIGKSLTPLAITLPVGISFYIFQTQAYVIDVYRGDVAAERNYINYGTYVTLFPQLIAGPIVKYTDVAKELHHRTVTLDKIQEGLYQFILGLGSKVLLANNLGSLWSDLEKIRFQGISTPLAWIALIAYGLQIYFDFSGYSLMAIGMGKMLGFKFPKNFDYPYISRSVTEFWRRWHITLGSWFREYVYIPLGGNRVSPMRQYFNIFVVWFLTGFWHGANWNFILWGLYFFLFLVIEKSFLLDKLEKRPVLSHVYLLFIITVGWGLFAITDFSQLGYYFTRLFTLKGGTDWIYYLRNYLVTIIAGIVLSTPVLTNWINNRGKGKVLIKTAISGVILLFSVAYLVDSSYNPFLYFRF